MRILLFLRTARRACHRQGHTEICGKGLTTATLFWLCTNLWFTFWSSVWFWIDLRNIELDKTCWGGKLRQTQPPQFECNYMQALIRLNTLQSWNMFFWKIKQVLAWCEKLAEPTLNADKSMTHYDTLWHSQISSDFSHCVWCHLFSQGREVGSLFYYVYVLLNLPWSCFSPSASYFSYFTTFICIPEAPYFSQSTVYRVSFFYPPPSCSICLLKWLRLYFHPSKHCRKCNRAINDSHLSMVVAPKLFKTKARASMSLRLSWLFCSAWA